MKKKVLACVLCTSMIATMFAGCGKKDEETQKTETQQSEAESTEKGLAEAETIDFDPLYHFNLDGTDEGLVAVVRNETDKGDNDGATYGIDESDQEILYADGPVGKCVRFDGTYGIKLPMETLNSNEYTISFWINADRLGDFGATVQMGHNIGKSDTTAKVSWINFTQTAFGADASFFPTVWNRNSDVGVWPWSAIYDGEVHGKKEWVMITLVATGKEYNFTDASTGAEEPRIQSKLYLDGVLYTDSLSADLDGYMGMAPDIFTESYGGFEAYLGINYWDTVFKGYMDDIYVYDKALTDGQVATLFAEGDKSVQSSADDASSDNGAAVTITGTAVGNTDCSSGFWSEFSETKKVESGASETVKFIVHNQADVANAWNTFFVVLQNVADGHSADANAAYKEYGVVRADNWGWCGADNFDTDGFAWTRETTVPDFSTFAKEMDGATVELTVTNNGQTADISATYTTAAGATYTQKYGNIAVDGDLYFAVGVDGSVLDMQ